MFITFLKTIFGKELDIPLVVTEQNPDKLGNTAKELDICHAKIVVPKTRFSMFVPQIQEKMAELFKDDCKPQNVVLYGIEVGVKLYSMAEK